MGFWGLGIVVAPILGPVLGGWLTDNYSWRWVFYINVPIGVVAVMMTTRVHLRPAVPQAAVARVDYWGLGLPGRRHRRAADRARQGRAGRLVRVELDHRAARRRRRRRWWRSSSASCASRIRSSISACSSERTYATGVVPDHAGRLRAVRQPGAAADHAADAAGLPAAAGRHRDGAARRSGRCIAMPLVGLLMAASRSAQAPRGRLLARRLDAVLAGGFEPAGRLLGHLLAAVHPGHRAWPAVRAADDRHDGSRSRASTWATPRACSTWCATSAAASASPSWRRGSRTRASSIRTSWPATSMATASRTSFGWPTSRPPSWREERTRQPPRNGPTPRHGAWCSSRRRFCRSSTCSRSSALVFLLMTPLILLMRRPTHAAEHPAAPVE